MRPSYSQSPPTRRAAARPSKPLITPFGRTARTLVFAALLTAILVAARSTPRSFVRFDAGSAVETEVAPFDSERARSALRRESDAFLRNVSRDAAFDKRTIENGWNAFFRADATPPPRSFRADEPTFEPTADFACSKAPRIDRTPASETSATSETAAVLAALALEAESNGAEPTDFDAAFRFLSELDVVRVDRARTVFAVSDLAPLDVAVPVPTPFAFRNPLNRLRPVSPDRIVEREPLPARATRATSPLLFAFWAIWAFCPVGGFPVDAPFFNVFSDSFRRLTAFFRLLRRRLDSVFLLPIAEFLNDSPGFVPTLATANVETTRLLN